MQNKGLIKFFAIIFTIACIYQLSFTFVANGIVKDAKEFAKGDSQKELNYLKSLKKKEVLNLGFASFTYEEIEKQQINNDSSDFHQHKFIINHQNRISYNAKEEES